MASRQEHYEHGKSPAHPRPEVKLLGRRRRRKWKFRGVVGLLLIPLTCLSDRGSLFVEAAMFRVFGLSLVFIFSIKNICVSSPVRR